MRSLRGSKQKVPQQGEMTAAQKDKVEQMKSMAKAYEGKSEGELLHDLTHAVHQGRKDGSVTDEKLDSIASAVSPMLDEGQKKKLEQILKSLKV